MIVLSGLLRRLASQIAEKMGLTTLAGKLADLFKRASQTPLPRRQRLMECFNRLRSQPASRTADEALGRISRTLEEVEDALSGVPRQSPPPPPNRPDGRMYPPLADNITRNPDGSLTARTTGHRIEIGADGSITIRNIQTGEIDFHQPGAEGD